MSLSRRLLAPATILAFALTASCKDNPSASAVDAAPSVVPDAAPAPGPAAASSAAATGRDAKRGAGGGPGAMLFEAALGLELKEEQKAKVIAAETLAHANDGDAARDAMKSATKEMHAEVIAGIKAGKIDAAKLEPRYAAIEKLTAEGHAKELAALGALHAALDPAQRKAAAAAVRAKQAAREEKMAHREGRDAGAADGSKGHPGGRRGVERLLRGLELDAEQQKKVDAIAAKDDGKAGRPDPVEMNKQLEALLAAFEKDAFDAKKLDAFDAKKARAPMEHETKVLAEILPLLKPEQRDKLAATMDKGVQVRGRRVGFGHRPQTEQDDD